jgi:predicted metal-dependent hydrolase
MPLRALLYRRPTEPQAIQIVFDKAIYLVRLRRHRQARRYTLRIQAATREVVLTMPPRGSLREAKEFAQKHGGWIAARLHRLPEAAPFAHGTTVPLRGQMHRIVNRRGMRGTVWIEIGENGERSLCVAGEPEHVDRRVHDFLKREARSDLDAASRCAAERLGVHIKRVSVRDQSSRWGSCSTTGVLSYSWRLILAPPFVLDYLAAHEVAHLVEMNHSARFWRLVDRICPNVARAKSWLDVHGTDLHRYGLLRMAANTDRRVPVNGHARARARR